jgi:hypothetical protein
MIAFIQMYTTLNDTQDRISAGNNVKNPKTSIKDDFQMGMPRSVVQVAVDFVGLGPVRTSSACNTSKRNTLCHPAAAQE